MNNIHLSRGWQKLAKNVIPVLFQFVLELSMIIYCKDKGFLFHFFGVGVKRGFVLLFSG